MQNKYVGGRKKPQTHNWKRCVVWKPGTRKDISRWFMLDYFSGVVFSSLFFFFFLLLPPPFFFYFVRNQNAHLVCWIFAWLCIPPCLKQLPSAPLARLTPQSTVNIPVEVKPLRGGGGAPRRLSRAGAAAPPQPLPFQPAANLPLQYSTYFSNTESFFPRLAKHWGLS